MAPQSPEFVIIEVGLSALVAALGRKRADRLLRDMAVTLTKRAGANVRRVNAPLDARSLSNPDMVAAAWFRENLPNFVARMPPD